MTAFIVANEAISTASLERHCKKQLAAYKVPSRYVLLDRLPKKTSKKLGKQKLRQEIQV